VHTHELHIDTQGNVHGEHLWYRSSDESWHVYHWKLAPDGTVTTTVPDGQVARGMGLLRDRQGNSYAVEQNNNLRQRTVIVRRAPDGRVTELAGGAYGFADGTGTAARLGSIGGVALAPDSTLYFADGSRLRRLRPDGTVTTLADRIDRPTTILGHIPGGRANALFGITLDRDANIHVADFPNGRVLKFAPDGKSRVTACESGFGWGPTGVWVEGRDLYILEYQNPGGDGVRVVRARDGKGIVIAKVP